MIRQVGVVASAVAMSIVSIVGLAPPAGAAGPRAVACGLKGSAVFKPGLTSKTAKSAYTFSGTLSSCQSSDATLKSGTAKAVGTANGTCAEGTSTGVAVLKWNNGKTTAVKFTTQSAGAVVEVSSTVVHSVVIAGVTYLTTEPATAVNDSGLAALAFQADATKCTTTTGITTATFQGQIGSGAPK